MYAKRLDLIKPINKNRENEVGASFCISRELHTTTGWGFLCVPIDV